MAPEVPEARAVLDAPGNTCASLTPLIKEHIASLQSGEILEVSEDPASREGVPAWSRMTGHALIASVEERNGSTRFFLRKK